MHCSVTWPQRTTPLDLLDLQQMVDGGLVEDRVAALRDERRVLVGQQRLDELRPAAVERAADQVLARVLPVLVLSLT